MTRLSLLLGSLLILFAACGPARSNSASSAPTGGSDRSSGRSLAGRSPTDRSAPTAHLSLTHIWTAHISPNADSAPAFAAHVHIRGRTTRAVVFVLAGNNGANCSPADPVTRATLTALDAATGEMLWTRSTSGRSRCTTAGPTVDPSGTWVYTVGLDGTLHRYAAGTGREDTSHVWPVRYTRMPDVEKVSATPTYGNNHVYVTTSGFIGDGGHYEGHLVSINTRTNSVHVFNSLCSNIPHLLGPTPGSVTYCPSIQSGLFGRGQGVLDPMTHDVYIVSGNGPWNGRTDWGDSILKLNSDGNHLLDSYTPTDQAYLNSADLDLGSTGPALLPTVTQGGKAYHLLVQGGKGARCASCGPVVLHLLNRDNLSGRGTLGQLGGDLQDIPSPGGCEVLTAPAVWKAPGGSDWVFYSDACGTAGYRLMSPSRGHFALQQAWSNSSGGTTPVLSHGVLYAAASGQITAYRPADGRVLWKGSGIGGVHWQYPTVSGSYLFMADQSGHVFAYRISR